MNLQSKIRNSLPAALAAALLLGLAPQRAAAISAPGSQPVAPVAPAVAAKPAEAAATPKPAVETEFKTLQDLDADARQDMSRWLAETAARDEHLAERQPHTLSLRMEHRFELVCAAYAAFRARHPGHATAGALEAEFRSEITEDLGAIREWEEGREQDPASPAPWNELAHYLAHGGRTVDAFACFEKSLALSPREAHYFFDFATALLLYRTDAARHYRLAEPEVIAKVLTLYRRGMKLEPASYQLAADYAQTFYLLGSARRDEGLAAWQHAYTLADSDPQRDEARTHLARYALAVGHFGQARLYLDLVQDPRLEPVKESLMRRVNETAKAGKADPAKPVTQ